MSTIRRPRKGSLQYWPRSRAKKILPSVNWKNYASLVDSAALLGIIAYKAGMVSVEVKDNTPHSMTKGKKMILPATILECPPMKIFSVRFYHQGKVAYEMLAPGLDKELHKRIKFPKEQKAVSFDSTKPYDDLRVLVYSLAQKTNIKKTPDVIELGVSGTLEDKKKYLQEKLGKEISLQDILKENMLVDIHGVTKGHGLTGPVKRFGIGYKSHKSEKGQKRPGSLGPWHPSRVTFRAPMAGQYGFFSRVLYNNTIVSISSSPTPQHFKHYGVIKNPYLLVKGSVTGPVKRQVLLTTSARASKRRTKQNYTFVEMR